MRGDKCTIQFYNSATDTEESARSFCEHNVPFHIIRAIPGAETSCEAEATLICDEQWIQLFGRCYRITKQLMKREEAANHCKKLKNSTIAYLHREGLPFRIKDYFTSVSRIWMDASEAITDNLIHDTVNGNLLLAIDGYLYDLPNLSLARVDASERAMVLCEYTPVMTQSESNYLLSRMSEIYFPTVETSEAYYIRTTSSLNRNVNDNFADNKYCTKVMKPFVPRGKAQSANPTREFIEKVFEANEHNKGLIIRTSAFSSHSESSKRTASTCAKKVTVDFRIFLETSAKPVSIEKELWKEINEYETCDAASWSSALVLSRKDEKGLEPMSDARYAPIYCQSIIDSYMYGDCPSGFTVFERKEYGQKWCHMDSKQKMNYEDAENHCKSIGAYVSGFSSDEEYDFLVEMMGTSYSINYGTEEVWVGARRREECDELGVNGGPGYSKEENSPCTRKFVYYWKEGAAPNPPMISDEHWIDPVEPNFMGQFETCLVMMRKYSGKRPLLNDVRCSYVLKFACGMEAPIVIKP